MDGRMISTRDLKRPVYSLNTQSNTISLKNSCAPTPQYFTLNDETGEETICTPDAPQRSIFAASCPETVTVTQRTLVKPSNQKTRKVTKKSSQALVQKTTTYVKKELDLLRKDFSDFAAKVKLSTEQKETNDAKDENEDDDEGFDYSSIWKWVQNLFSYRLYKETDIVHMQQELQKHKQLCEEMCKKSHFWKGKICHFIETGQQDWKISDKYFMELGHRDNLALE